MNLLTKTGLLWHIACWRLRWNRRNTRKAYAVSDNAKFMSARDAIRRVPDGATVAVSGLAGNQRASILYWSIRELFEETGHPHDLHLICIGGHGSRGRAPGTVEELGLEGLVTRLTTAHVESFKSFLKLADAGQLDIQCLPQGVLAMLLDAQGRGEDSILTSVGVGTFVDPRVGRGTPLDEETGEQWVTAEDGQLRYRIPKVEAALFNLPAADREGNLYAKHCAMVGESREIALAAKKNGGLVIANVAMVVDKGYDSVFLPADKVDAIVVFSGTEQTGSIPHRKYWPLFTPGSTMPVAEGADRLRFINRVLGITPRRSAADTVLARLAASVLVKNVRKGAFVNVGTGLPEEVCYLLARHDLTGEITLFTEGGVIGGMPAPGIFFGAAVNPKEILPSVEAFKRCQAHLDVTMLGMLEADGNGNVNASKRDEGVMNYVGPGGFLDFTAAARTVIFVSSWMARARTKIANGRLSILERGKPKFVHAVGEVTLNGQEALRAGKTVLYVTHIGVFQLTSQGMELKCVMPGVDIQRDILDVTPMRVVLPETETVPRVEESIVTGKGFRLRVRDDEA